MSKFTVAELEHMMKQAQQDDWHRIFVGSEIRVLISMAMQLSALEADAQRLVDAAIYTDSYGVSGSDFRACRICDHSNQPGLNARADWHPETCAAKQMEIALSVRQQDRYERRPTANKCACGLHEVPRGVDGVNWYWQRHAREGCALELPNEKCWCGRLRSEHIDGHGEVGQQEKGRG